MDRVASKAFDNWLVSRNRKPMVLRGARQVGKTWIVRDLAKRHHYQLIELNFEKQPNLADLFSSNDSREILKNLGAEFGIQINSEKSILFLDEIQVIPALLAKLRWFYEEIPELPVIAAGSLLEFAMSKASFSMPVGRVTYYYLTPFSFSEFLQACGKQGLIERFQSFIPQAVVPASLHKKYLDLYYSYCLVGGMPEVVQDWITHQDLPSCIKMQEDLLATFRDDFHKYGGRLEADLLFRLMLSVCDQLGQKYVFSRVDPSLRIPRVKASLDLLLQARICTKIHHTAANGLPLGAESNEKIFKMIMLDIGLVSTQLGLSSMRRSEARKAVFSNKGGLAEQFVGQQLRILGTPLSETVLYHWQRTGGRAGEIDYIVQMKNRIIPIEVKAGAAGKMKSLHQFMAEKGLDFAVRCYTGDLAIEKLNLKTTQGDPVSYTLLSIPLYLTERLPDLIERC